MNNINDDRDHVDDVDDGEVEDNGDEYPMERDILQ